MVRVALSIGLLLAAPHVARAGDAAQAFGDRALPVLKAHCASCHGGDQPKAQLDLSGPRTIEQLKAESRHWFQVLERVEAGSMPPPGKPPLKPAERQALAGWVRGELTDLLLVQQLKDGRSRLRRLNRNEYANTIQDIFGIRPPVVRELPVDGRVDGFDKVSAALPFSSAHAAGYLKITEDTLARFPFRRAADKAGETQRLWARESEQSRGHILELPDDWKVSFNTDTTSGPVRSKTGWAPRVPGVHHLRLSVYGYQTDKPLPFGIYVGKTGAYPQIIELVQVLEAPPGKPTVLETDVYLRTRTDSDLGDADFIRLIPFGLGVPVPKNAQASNCKGPGLALQWIDVTEPAAPAGDQFLFGDVPAPFRDEFANVNLAMKFSKMPRAEIEAVARKTYSRVGARLQRRDLTPTELAALMKRFTAQIDGGGSFRGAVFGEISAMMTAPDFLCVIEKPGKLSDFALAARLSYFLWNSAPDDELLAVARKGRLKDPQGLREQTERLLKDPRSQRFVKDFVDQWLGLWAADNTTPDKDLYPEYDELLKYSSVLETRETFRRILDKNLSVRDFVAPDWALVNARLAQVYGFPNVAGVALKEVRLPADTPYGGLWTQAATMKVTANGTNTSPVKRGVWVAERLLGVTIPPPPPNIEPVDPDIRGAKTLRQQLALHSGKGSCAACHARFDPYGFALESFDVMGNFRTKYRVPEPGQRKWKDGLAVDCAGSTPGGKAFANIRELRALLAKTPDQLAFGVTRHLLTYATGTPAGPLEQRAIEHIVQQTAKENYGLRSLVHGVVQSELFGTK